MNCKTYCHCIVGLLVCTLSAGFLTSCKKYLDVKPDKALVVPSTMADCQALLDNYIIMTINFPPTEHLTDNFYLTYTNWNSQTITNRDGYIWRSDFDILFNTWLASYQKVLYANQVLETLAKITPLAPEQDNWNAIKGAALFYRGFSLYMAAQLWAKSYDSTTAATDMGIPLRLTPDISTMIGRGTVKDLYGRILQDLNEAVNLLPATRPTSIILKSRPCKASAYAILARIYQSMGDYNNAIISASAALQIYNTLIDYNTLSQAPTGFPIAKYNSEVLFEANTSPAQTLAANIAKVDSNLYRSYQPNDLRKVIFFRQNTGVNAGTYQFIGGYLGGSSTTQFCGPATDEVYFIRAESYARAGNINSAMSDLNTVLRKRWVTNTYVDMTATNADDALAKILTERRKELLFRGLRWTDLRRLNKDARFATTLTRELNGTIYSLPPNDLRYVLLIPLEVLRREPFPQNPR